ncbi:MAG TPA: hypothetical protein VGB66_08400 [Longimicrobium sp.]|jgi:hypothetical protein
MSLREMPWEWISAGLAALVIVLLATRRPQRRSRSALPHSAAPTGDGGQTGYAEIIRLTGEVRHLLGQQAKQMEQLRTTLGSQIHDIGEKVDALAATRTSGGQARGERRDPVPASFSPPPNSGHGEDSSWLTAIPAVPSWSAGPADQAVEIRDGALVRSRSLPPAAYVTPSGAGQARVYLNPDVQMTEISLPKWEAFFDLQGGRTYTAYRTTRPAEVAWDEGEGRGELVSKGLAEAI